MRTEYAAFHFFDNIVWLAYYRTGDNKEDTAYTVGWTSDLEGAERYAELRRVLESQFGYDSRKPFMVDATHTNRIVGFGSPFIGCTQVFFDAAMPAGIKAVMMSWFLESGVACLEISAPWQTIEAINSRWADPMGGPLENNTPHEIGQNHALTVMQAGLGALQQIKSQESSQPRSVVATAVKKSKKKSKKK